MFDPIYLSLTTIIGIVIWSIRLEGRVNEANIAVGVAKVIADQRLIDLKELITTQLEAIDTRLERIERKVLNGSYTAR